MKNLQKNDKIAIISTARKITYDEIKQAIEILESWGLVPVLGANLFCESNQYSGTDEQRATDLQAALDDDEIKAIICARGGYGTVRIIDNIDFTKFLQNPKWIIGYSDVTVLHSHIQNNFGIETIHGSMLLNFTKNSKEALSSLQKALFQGCFSHETIPHPLNREGNAEGVLIGGNLSLLYALNNTVSDLDTDGKILFIEDLDEYLYHIDRMILTLKRSGKLSNLAGLVVGELTDMRDNTIPFGKTAEEIIIEAVTEFNYPVCFGFPAGHIDDNRALILGQKVKLTVGKIVLLESFL
jgi:muramoyltetrapeptide carboxypeptidase